MLLTLAANMPVRGSPRRKSVRLAEAPTGQVMVILGEDFEVIDPHRHILPGVMALLQIVIFNVDAMRVLMEGIKHAGWTGTARGFPLVARAQNGEFSDSARALQRQMLSILENSRITFSRSKLMWCFPHSFLGVALFDTSCRIIVR